MQQDLHLVPLLLVLCSTTACSFISTNKFVLDTNYSFTVSPAVGSANERRQSRHHCSLFVSSVTGVGGGGRQTMHSLLAVGLKVAPFGGGSGRSKGWDTKRCMVILKGIFSLSLVRVGVWGRNLSFMYHGWTNMSSQSCLDFPFHLMLSTHPAWAHLFLLPILWNSQNLLAVSSFVGVPPHS